MPQAMDWWNASLALKERHANTPFPAQEDAGKHLPKEDDVNAVKKQVLMRITCTQQRKAGYVRTVGMLCTPHVKSVTSIRPVSMWQMYDCNAMEILR